MELTRIGRWLLAAALTGSFGLCSPAATPDQPAPTMEGATLISRDPVESSRLLGPVLTREETGFRIMPPAGSHITESKSLDEMSFIVDAKSWGGSVQRITLKEVMSIEDFVKTIKADVASGKTFKGAQVLKEAYDRKDNRPAVRLEFSMQADLGLVSITDDPDHTMKRSTAGAANNGRDVTVTLFRQELVVQTKDNEFYTLNMYAPLDNRGQGRDKAAATFEAMVAEFEIFDPVAKQRHRAQAIAAGKAWLAARSAEEYMSKLINQPIYYRILVGGNDLGYMRFDESTQEPDPKGGGGLVNVERDGHKGVIFHVNSRSFPSDGSVVYGLNEAFWGISRTPSGERINDYSCWTNISKIRTLVPVPANQQRPGGPTLQVVTPWRQETGVLTQADQPHQMLVTLTGDAGQRLPEGINRIIPAELTAPLPKILEYSWTRFVDLTKPSEMTFVVFDSATAKLANRTFIVTGTRESVTIDGKSVSCYKCEDDLDPNSTTIWTDSAGHIMMMRTNDQTVMVPTTEAAMFQKWAGRLKDQ